MYLNLCNSNYGQLGSLYEIFPSETIKSAFISVTYDPEKLPNWAVEEKSFLAFVGPMDALNSNNSTSCVDTLNNSVSAAITAQLDVNGMEINGLGHSTFGVFPSSGQ